MVALTLGSPEAIMRFRVVRALLVALAVGALVGVVVAGGGARLAMRLIALADDREDFGQITSSEAVVGEITFGGTVFVLLTGMALGIFGAFMYLSLRAWMPSRRGYRSMSFVLIVVGFGLSLTIDGNQGDFVFLNTGLSIVSFAVVLMLYALIVPPLIDRLAPPTTRPTLWGHGVVICVLALSLFAGALAVEHAFEYADGSRVPG